MTADLPGVCPDCVWDDHCGDCWDCPDAACPYGEDDQ